MTDQDRADLTPYDLAARAAAGQPLTDAAHREIAAELLRVSRAANDAQRNMSKEIDSAWDVVTARPRSAEKVALEALWGKAAFRVADDAGVADRMGAGLDAVRRLQEHIALAYLNAVAAGANAAEDDE